MTPFIITYTEGGETSHAMWSGYDADHACERFTDAMEAEGGSEGIRIISACYAPEFRKGRK